MKRLLCLLLCLALSLGTVTALAEDEWEDEEGEWKMYTAGIYNVVVSLDEGWVKLIKTDQFNLFPMNVYLATAEGCTLRSGVPEGVAALLLLGLTRSESRRCRQPFHRSMPA